MHKIKKVLHLINSLSSGGAELHLLSLCRCLQYCGIEIVVTCLKEHIIGSQSIRKDFEQEGMKVISSQAEKYFDGRGLGRIALTLAKESPDILHTHLPRADFFGALTRMFSPQRLWVCSVHDIYSKSWSGKWTLPLFRRLWRRADAVIAISQAVKDWLVREQGLPAEKIWVIHYGIDAEPFFEAATANTGRSEPHACCVVGTMGRLEPRKGHETLIRAMNEVLPQVPHASLRIAGHDPWSYREVLESLITEQNVREQVQLVGFQHDVPAFLHGLDVFALASSSEGFGQVMIEAMAAGKPVVASNIAPMTEIVVDGETGLLAEVANPKAFAEAICWLLTHPQEAREMGRRGQERVRRYFSADRMAAQTLSLYQTLLARRG